MQKLLIITKLKKRQKELFENTFCWENFARAGPKGIYWRKTGGLRYKKPCTEGFLYRSFGYGGNVFWQTAGFSPLLKNNKQQLTRLNDHRPPQQQTLKPSSTVTGFKKRMYNFVKLSQNQLQPSYSRRKYNHSHYNQTLKERTKLNRIYAYLSKPTIKSYCAFTIKPFCWEPEARSLRTISRRFGTKNLVPKVRSFASYAKFCTGGKIFRPMPQLTLDKNISPSGAFGRPFVRNIEIFNGPEQSFPNNPKILHNAAAAAAAAAELNAHSLLNNYNKARPTNPQMTYHRPIPKIVNFLESRLDIILWKNQFVNSIKSARQTLRQGILVNGGFKKKSNFQTLPGDVFTFI